MQYLPFCGWLISLIYDLLKLHPCCQIFFLLRTNDLVSGVTLWLCLDKLANSLSAVLAHVVHLVWPIFSFNKSTLWKQLPHCNTSLSAFWSPSIIWLRKTLIEFLSDKWFIAHITHTQRCWKQTLWTCHLIHKKGKVYISYLKTSVSVCGYWHIKIKSITLAMATLK